MTKIGGCNDLGPGVYCCECGDEITDALAHDCPVLGEHHHDHDPQQPGGYDEDAEHSILYEGAQPALSMMQQVRDRLGHLTCLPPNWNGYKESPISEAAADEAYRVAEKIILLGATPPFIAPVADGGVQLEWALGGFDIEIEVTPALVVEYSAWHRNEDDALFCGTERSDADRCHKMFTDLAGVRTQARSLGTRR